MQITPALWSAVAATFSAVTSIVMMSIQRANRRDAARPEIVLDDWQRYTRTIGGTVTDTLAFKAVRNVGKGPALHVTILAFESVGDAPTALMGNVRLPIVAAGERVEAPGEVSLWWNNVAVRPDGSTAGIGITMRVFAWDAIGHRYETEYRLYVAQVTPVETVPDAIAPGVALSTRVTKTAAPVWRLRMTSLLGVASRDSKTLVRRLADRLMWWRRPKKKELPPA